MKSKLTVLIPFLFLGVFAMGETLVILHAGSLTRPIRDVETAFNKEYGTNVFFKDESYGSIRVVKSITELGKLVDVVAVADYSLIPQYLIPKYTSWYIQFATNKLVIAYTKNSKYANEINAKNWYEILQRPRVEFGFSNPNIDPCGYRTRLMFELAQKYYKVPNLSKKLISLCPLNNVKPKSIQLVADLQSGELDYAFEYLSVAKQNKLKYVELPSPLNFGDPKYEKFYSQAALTLENGKSVFGKPIIYGVTIPNNAPHKKLAQKFLAFLLGKEGKEIFEKNGQPPIALKTNVALDQLPQDIKNVIQEENEKK